MKGTWYDVYCDRGLGLVGNKITIKGHNDNNLVICGLKVQKEFEPNEVVQFKRSVDGYYNTQDIELWHNYHQMTK